MPSAALNGLFSSAANTWFVCGWAGATAVLAASGDRADALQGLVVGLALLTLLGITQRFTGAPRVPVAPPNARLGAIVVVLTVGLTALDPLVADPSGLLAAWNKAHWAVTEWIAPVIPILDRESIDNSVRYVLLPLIPLVIAGWRPRDFGCGPARPGAARAVLLWSAPPLVAYAVGGALLGHGKLAAVAHGAAIDVFRNGYAEELLFRGLLLGVLTRRFGLTTGNVAQALVFGLWHLGADLRDTHNVWLALAEGVSTQAIAGYAYGKLTQRTGNILAAGASHALYDAGSVFA